MNRTALLALALTTTLIACSDIGLEGNLPLEEAMARPPSELVAAVYRPTETVPRGLVVDGRLWVPSGLPLTLDPARVRAIGSADGQTVYARGWDQAPYDEVFTRLESQPRPGTLGPLETGAWLAYAPVIGRTGPGAGAAEHPGTADVPSQHQGH